MKGTWPASIFAAPLLRGLDERGKQELARAGSLRHADAGETLYRAGDRAGTVFVVASGKIELRAAVRGAVRADELREVGASDTFGEEAYIGAARCAAAQVTERAHIAELPAEMLRRTLVRAGGGEVAERAERRLRRRATAELLATAAFAGELSDDDMELLLDGAEHRTLMRGDVVFRQGERARYLWLVASGMVQLQSEDEERLRVVAYLSAGDVFGDEELLSEAPRPMSAIASGASLLIAIERRVARTVADRNPGLLRKLRRVTHKQADAQEQAIGAAASHATQHAFRDLYRLSVARSLLVIDLDSCVRCGHCAWSCESLHGVARLVRRGDKIVTRMDNARMDSAGASAPLLLPNSCQHCENPACMPDCPTGAIGRDPGGEVFIRDALCTGCGACAKGCPWDNIQIVPRPPGAPRPPQPEGMSAFDELAVKCDLCRGYDGPACVKACPTEAILRIHPSEDLPEVAGVLHAGEGTARARRRGSWPITLGAALAGLALVLVGARMQASGQWVAWRGPGYAFGVGTALSLLLLWAYVLPKRGLAWWQRRKARAGSGRAGSGRDGRASSKRNGNAADGTSTDTRNTTRSITRPQLLAHMALGLLSLGAVVAHGGLDWGASAGAGLAMAFLASGAVGIAAALSYAWLPRRLSRIEPEALLPEDYGAARRALDDRLYGSVSGKSEVVKRLFQKVLAPYAGSRGGWLGLLLSGRTLRQERARLRARIDTILQGRGSEKLAGLDRLIRTVVERRALTAQRVLTASLRMWLPLHLVLATLAAVLLLLHLAEVLG